MSLPLEQCKQKCIGSSDSAAAAAAASQSIHSCRNGFSYDFDHGECRIPREGLDDGCSPQKGMQGGLLSLQSPRLAAPPQQVAFYEVHDVDDCSPNPCGEHGLCHDRGYGLFECECVDGWMGTGCEADV